MPEVQLADEVVVSGMTHAQRGWLINIRGTKCKVFLGNSLASHIDLSRIQLKTRPRASSVPWILEGIARILIAQNIVDEPIPRIDFNNMPGILQKQIHELTRSCSYTAFRNYVFSCIYADQTNDNENQLDKKIEELKLAVSQLTKIKIKQTRQISELEDRKEILDQLVTELTGTNSHLQLDRDKLNLEKSEYSAKLFQITNQHDDLAEISQETIRKLESDRNRMLNKIEQLTKACRQSNIELEELELKQQKTNFEYHSIKSVRDGLVAENFQLKGSVTQLTRECERFQTRNKTLIHDKNDIQQKFDALKTKFIHLDEDSTTLKLKNEGLERNVSKLTAILKEKNDNLGRVQIELEETRLRCETRDNRIQNLMTINKKSSDDNTMLKKDLHRVQGEYREYRGEMEPKVQSLNTLCQSLEDDLAESRSRIKTLLNDNVLGKNFVQTSHSLSLFNFLVDFGECFM